MKINNAIINGECIAVMSQMEENQVDLVLTSPFYNTNKKAGKGRTLKNTKVSEGNYTHVRYDEFVDNYTNEEYYDFTVDLFNQYSRVLKENGVILYNMSYGSENTECMFRTVSEIICRTEFTVADCIIWKKKSAIPNNCSPNKLTRIVEHVYVFCRKDELKTFKSGKKQVSERANGQKMYENVYNFIEAKNNDGATPLNKATFSTELCEKLLSMYGAPGITVLDSFNGTGTTGLAAKRMEMDYIGIELSKNQCEYSVDRIFENTGIKLNFVDKK